MRGMVPIVCLIVASFIFFLAAFTDVGAGEVNMTALGLFALSAALGWDRIDRWKGRLP